MELINGLCMQWLLQLAVLEAAVLITAAQDLMEGAICLELMELVELLVAQTLLQPMLRIHL
jgi:hypothetical protein